MYGVQRDRNSAAADYLQESTSTKGSQKRADR